jgi:hypothetical protein
LEKAVSAGRDFSTPDGVFNANKFLFYIDERNEDSSDQYFKGFQNYVESSDIVDVALFERKVAGFLNENDLDRAIKYSDMIINLEGTNTHSSCVKLLSILYLKMKAIKDQSRLVNHAEMLKGIIDKTSPEDLKLTTLNKDLLKSIKGQTERLLITLKPVEQVIRSDRKFGRNEVVKVRYEDGREESKKYKLVKESLSLGKCAIVSDPA